MLSFSVVENKRILLKLLQWKISWAIPEEPIFFVQQNFSSLFAYARLNKLRGTHHILMVHGFHDLYGKLRRKNSFSWSSLWRSVAYITGIAYNIILNSNLHLSCYILISRWCLGEVGRIKLSPKLFLKLQSAVNLFSEIINILN